MHRLIYLFTPFVVISVITIGGGTWLIMTGSSWGIAPLALGCGFVGAAVQDMRIAKIYQVEPLAKIYRLAKLFRHPQDNEDH